MKSKVSYKKCLYCPVIHKFLKEFLNYYDLRRKIKPKDKAKIEQLKHSIKTMSAILRVNGTFSETDKLYWDLLNMNMDMSIVPNGLCDCIHSINYIVSQLKILFYKQNNDYEVLYELKKNGISILSEMSKCLAQNNIDTYCLSEDEKKWDKKYKLSIGFTFNDDEYEDDPKDEAIDKANKTYDNFRSIVIDYCNSNIQYQYCLPELGYDKALNNCQPQDNSNEHPLMVKRVLDLNDGNYEMICNYLEQAPKAFPKILKRIMNYQGLGYSDVADLWVGTKKPSPSSIKKLTDPQSKTNRLTPEDYKVLQRILLVSESVLRDGKGTLYGNWKIALDEANNDTFTESLSKDTELFNTATEQRINKLKKNPATSKIFNSEYKLESDKKGFTTELIKGRIRDLISQSDEDYNAMLTENDNFFFAEPINLYLYQENDEYVVGEEESYFDIHAAYEDLKNPTEFELILSLIEQKQRKELNNE